jgi:D-cysteine desulfhydrase/L-cysteate sulfo-lyase
MTNFPHISFPKAELCHAPTPLERLENLSRALNGPKIFIKRDDCTGLAMGGNKARQLEYYLGQARAMQADTILITGAVQSNYVRMAAAAARCCAMDCHVQLEERVARRDHLYRNSGNVLLDRILGATIHSYPDGEDEAGADARLEELASDLRANGARPYVIHLSPGRDPLGALGYVTAAGEILDQITDREISITDFVVASGSGATHAGLLAGLRARGSAIRVWGICVRRGAGAQKERVADACRKLARMLKIDPVVSEEDVLVTDATLAPGYGMLNDATEKAIRLMAVNEGIFLDPVYTGKSAAGMIKLIESGEIGKTGPDAGVLFIHTGGTPALFAYGQSFKG